MPSPLLARPLGAIAIVMLAAGLIACRDGKPRGPIVVIVYRPAAPSTVAELDRAVVGLRGRFDDRDVVDARFNRRGDTIVAELPADEPRLVELMTAIIHRVARLDLAVVAPSSELPCELAYVAHGDELAHALGVESYDAPMTVAPGVEVVDCFLRAPERIALVTYLALATSRPGGPGVPDDRRLWIERTYDGSAGWRTRYLQHPVLLSGSWLVGADAWFAPDSTDFGAVIDLDPAVIPQAAALAGPGPRDLAFLIDGQIKVVVPQAGPMGDGRVHLLVGSDEDEDATHDYFNLMSVLQASYVPPLVEVSRTPAR